MRTAIAHGSAGDGRAPAKSTAAPDLLGVTGASAHHVQKRLAEEKRSNRRSGVEPVLLSPAGEHRTDRDRGPRLPNAVGYERSWQDQYTELIALGSPGGHFPSSNR